MQLSPPSRGAWIEMLHGGGLREDLRPSPPSRGAWIEIGIKYDISSYAESPPSRGAWIEIPMPDARAEMISVAPLAGGVD